MSSKRQIWVGGVPIGGGAPVAVQSLTKTETADYDATIKQIREIADAGGDLVRCAVPREKDVDVLKRIVVESPIPVIADIHFNYTLHLGITEAGTKWSGSLKSAVGLGTLLADGIGDTIRISLSTFHAEEEVKVAWEILKALKLRERGPVLIACPTCGRLQFDMDRVVAEVEQRLEDYEDPIEVSVLGCAVNGIGEARHADFGITGAKDMGMIYSRGEPLKKVPTERLVDELFAEIDRYYAAGKRVVRDEARAAEARDWLAENEDASAMTPERMAALEAQAADGEAEIEAEAGGDGAPSKPYGATPARLDEQLSPVSGRRFTRA